MKETTQQEAGLPAASGFAFCEPFDGGILHEQSGDPVLGVAQAPDGTKALKVAVCGTVPPGVTPIVALGDGTPVAVRVAGGTFEGVATLRDRITTITATAVINGTAWTILTRPVWAQETYPRYHCYIDDNILFFRDIVRQNHKSIFDNPYLYRLRELHRTFGVKITLNCFHTTPERDFSLAMFPDRYKGEFEDHAHWLRLAFHADNEFPDDHYREATPARLATDFDMVATELQRIAGHAYTTGMQLHWADASPACYRVLAERGVKMLFALSRPLGSTAARICDYHLPDAVLAYLCRHQGWLHFESGLIFFDASSGGCDWTPIERIVPNITQRMSDPARGQLLTIAGHEQYWQPDYHNFVPDIFERFQVALRHVTDNGYAPVWLEDGFFATDPARAS